MVGNAAKRVSGSRGVYNLSPTFSPFHVFGFNRRSLQMLLNKHGFDVEDVLVWAQPRVPSSDDLRDKVKATVATQIRRVANLTGTASNMCVWARRRDDGSSSVQA
jgi:hypothetical protein